MERIPETNKFFQFSGYGDIYSFTTVYEAPLGFEYFTPYVVALVRLIEGPLITSQITDLTWKFNSESGRMEPDIKIGDKLEMVTRKLRIDGDPYKGLIVYGFKFRKAGEIPNFTPNPR